MLAAATRTIALLRPAPKPLHPDGVTLVGRLVRQGSSHATGISWLDEAGDDEVVVRLSRAIGLPAPLPDIHGLALRVPTDGGTGDLLLASTGWGPLSRFVLTLGRRPGSRPLTSLLPYRTRSGALVLGARRQASGYQLFWAPGRGDWHGFATLVVTEHRSLEQEISFDPVRHQIPGLEQYPVVVRLREPAYLRARRSRRDAS